MINKRKGILKFVVITVLYLVFVIWVGSVWPLIFIPVIFDVCITKKVNWTFWKKRNGPNSVLVEWIDAIIFAVVVVSLVNLFIFQNYKIPTGSMEKTLLIGDHLYVSKLKYGPKMPNTPLSLPFMHNIIPGTMTKSYSDIIKWPYKRLKGFTTVKRNDIVVFNFPEGDTVVLQAQNESYYDIVRQYVAIYRREDTNNGRTPKNQETYEEQARKYIVQNFDVTARPVDKKDNYVKRCVALPGETIEVKSGHVWINGEKQTLFPGVQFEYRIITDGTRLNDKFLEKMGIYRDDVTELGESSYIIPITAENVAVFESMPSVKSVYKVEANPGAYDERVFPHSPYYQWNVNHFGPLTIPFKGQTVNLTEESIVLYERIITAYEGNKLEKTSDGFLINGKKATTYTFGMDYYFMMGDNRDHSLDSRYWGFVPEDHIVGAPRRVWLSLDKEGSFPFNIRWGRFFKSAGGQ